MTGGRSSGATIGNILATVFPNGTQGLDRSTVSEISQNDIGKWETIPVLPYDVFAFCAHLIQISGLMGYFEPDEKAKTLFGPGETLKVVLPKVKRGVCLDAADHWRTHGKPDPHTHGLWKAVHQSAGLPTRIKEYQKLHKYKMEELGETSSSAPDWWSAVFELLIIADETCELVGHKYTPQNDPDANAV